MKKALLMLAGLAMASLAMAQLAKYKDWAKSPDAYFLTPPEREEWGKIKTDEDAEKFIALYWAKRDPTPGTPQNEFHDAVLRRIAAADEQFKMRRYARGAESTRGHVFITLGPPTKAASQRASSEAEFAPGAPVQPGIGEAAAGGATTSTWTYEKDKFDSSWGIGELRARFSVDVQRGSDELTNSREVEKAIAKVAEKTIVSPGGQPAAPVAGAPIAPAPAASAPAVPAAATGPGAAAAPAAKVLPPAPATASLPAAARSTLDTVLKEKKEAGGAGFWAGPFRTIPGDSIYALEFYIPADKAPAGPLKFGGVVTNESGADAATYWEDATLSDMKSGNRADKVYERSVVLPAGSYNAAFGLFPGDGSAPIASSSASFKLSAKSGDFEVSPLILANTLTPLTKRPSPTDPFVFGLEKPIRVEPKANHLFAKEDSLWYFYTVSNPVLPAAPAASAPAPAPAAPGAPSSAEATKGTPAAAAPAAAEAVKPRIMARIGVLKDGQPAFAPFSGPAEMQLLGAGTAYYATGSEIPLASFEPGFYTFTLNVRDLNAPRDSAAFKGVDRKEDFVVLKADGSMPEKAAPSAAKPGAKQPAKPKAAPKKG